ncbi:MAG TPA: hypothetical protein VKQ36_16645, partial [Ktedonobacterales bacterium]|nr:hypothetical protein [Ktedonobacterales bacterium]
SFVPILLLVAFFVLLFQVGRRNMGSLRERQIAQDQAAVALCGDPLALMAVLLTTTLLGGGDINRRVTVNALSTRDRITALEQALRQPGPFAPWAFQPIPCIVPLQVGPYALSVPLTPEAKAMPPATLVPMARYPQTDSPWAALPMMEGAYNYGPSGAPVVRQPGQ